MVIEAERTHASLPQIYELRNPENGTVMNNGIQAAIRAIKGEHQGVHAFAFINGGVNAIVGDAEVPSWVVEAKGVERERKPMALAMTTQQIHPFINLEAIRPDLQPMFDNPEMLARYFGWLCFVRVPVRDDSIDQLPASTLSKRDDGSQYVQFWDPRGNKYTSRLVQDIQEAGVKFVGISSLNKSGSAELTTEEEGIAYCTERNIPIFLRGGAKDSAKGSFTILGVDRDGIKVQREGNIPSEYLVPKDMLAPNQPQIERPRFPPYRIPEKLFESYRSNQPRLRIAMLAHLNGYTEDRILQTLRIE